MADQALIMEYAGPEMEPEDMTDENIWGLLGDFMEWTMYETVPLLVVVILLIERFAREAVAQWGNYKAKKHDNS